jgi:hypothetical protein
MIVIKIKGQTDTPHVILDAGAGNFELSGKSMPEDVNAFYEPIMEWLSEYKDEANPLTEFFFKMTYFNSASSKFFHEIMNILKEIQDKGNKVKVIWFHDEDDEAMEDAGEEFKEMVKIPFEIHSN